MKSKPILIPSGMYTTYNIKNIMKEKENNTHHFKIVYLQQVNIF